MRILVVDSSNSKPDIDTQQLISMTSDLHTLRLSLDCLAWRMLNGDIVNNLKGLVLTESTTCLIVLMKPSDWTDLLHTLGEVKTGVSTIHMTLAEDGIGELKY